MHVSVLRVACVASFSIAATSAAQNPAPPPERPVSIGVENPKPTRAERAHSSWIGALSFSADGARLATGAADSTNSIKIWSVADGALEARLDGLPGRTFALNAEGERALDALGHSGLPTSLAFTPDGRTLVSASTDNTVKVWSLAERRVVATRHGRTTLRSAGEQFEVKDPLVWAARLSPDGKTLFYADRVGDIQILGLPELKEIGSIQTLLPIAYSWESDLRLAADGKRVAMFDFEDIEIWDVASRQSVRRISVPSGAHTAIALSADGGILAAGSREKIRMFDATTGAMLRELNPPRIRFQVYALSFTPDGRRLIAATNAADTAGVQVWSVADGSVVARLRMPDYSWVRIMAISPDGTLLATGSELGHVCIWALEPFAFRRCLVDRSESK